MTTLPKHIQALRDELAIKQLVSTLDKDVSKYSTEGFELGFNSAFELMLKDMESMAKALEKANGALRNVENLSRRIPDLRGFHPFEEELKTWREKYKPEGL